MLTIEQVKHEGWLVFESIAGSKAYGLDTDRSDTDIRGVFILPEDRYFALEYTPQVSNESNDIVYYELKRFVELLTRNNPNILELLNVPDHCVLFKHPVMESIRPEMFLSKLCEKSFANYAFTQIRKAYGLEKKILNPVEERRKSVLDFCWIRTEKDAIPLQDYALKSGYDLSQLGLAAIDHMRDCFNLYYSATGEYAGILRGDDSNDVCLSDIPKSAQPVGLLYFNKDGYSAYCKRYREYWEWVAKRNEERYNTTIAHGKKYDSKNMMHVFRLLKMAKEIAVGKTINVWRADRDFLLAIKQGKYEYDELLQQAEALKSELPALYAGSGLQEEPNRHEVDRVLVDMRRSYYAGQQPGR